MVSCQLSPGRRRTAVKKVVLGRTVKDDRSKVLKNDLSCRLSKEGMESHIKDFHGTETMICDKCSYTTNQRSVFANHVKQCGLLFTCTICHMKLPKKSMRHHYKVKHIGHEKEPCKLCGKVVQSKLMKYHLKEHLPDEMKKFQCRFCTKGYNTLFRLKRHENSHAEQSIKHKLSSVS